MASICRECGKSFTPARSDAAYCSSPCRQRAYRERNQPNRNVTVRRGGADLDRPVPVAGHDWSEVRFWIDEGNYVSRPIADADAVKLLENYVSTIASIAIAYECDNCDCGETWYDSEPLPDRLPAVITPDGAGALASRLEPALDRASELLALLQRRSRETWR